MRPNPGLAAGADDFLSKPFDRKELELRRRALVRLRRHELLIREQINEVAEMEALKDDLVHLMVHDLRNPLSGLMGSLGLIQEAAKDGNADLREDVRTANESALRLRELLDDVLQVRLLEGRQVPLQQEEVRLSDVAAQAIETMSGDARMREVEVVLHRGADPKIRVDRNLVRRSVENLVAPCRWSRRCGCRRRMSKRPLGRQPRRLSRAAGSTAWCSSAWSAPPRNPTRPSSLC